MKKNIIDVIKDRNLKIKPKDLIYASGLFDYLPDRMASDLINYLFKLLNNKGNLIICNVSLENSSHRAYYEMLGGWNMFHRTKEQMFNLAKEIRNASEIYFRNPHNCDKYLFLCIRKK